MMPPRFARLMLGHVAPSSQRFADAVEGATLYLYWADRIGTPPPANRDRKERP